QRQHQLLADVPPGLRVNGDAHRLQQVFSNLLTNAAKYTPPGGRITIKASREGEVIVVRVADTGVGIGPDLLPRVFARFVQGRQELDRAQGGLGLGLAIVRRMVELHGGNVSATSDGPGHGTTLTVQMPAVEADVDAGGDASMSHVASSHRPKDRSVLIVDDNEDAAEMLSLLMQALGYTTRTAHDGPSALTLLDSFRPDVAVLDIGLPVMDGYELARRLRDRPDPGPLTLIAVTGYGRVWIPS
ncbi:MAG TPA: hybrid sensor histidine kinase/response regulator, partial [Plantibacter sp.]|uniref:hybrid sensor histidine kinase/response regulator n=1 Tax=Plantibacter sp. TaxID=1871045 RepID=UPI002CC79C29|nr:hybrid sensor histidine kinase/response regulator [Plantibacter sp.]